MADIEPHIVIQSNRYTVVPEELRRIAVQYDHKVETVTFDCPRYWDGLDMSEMHVYINYQRSDGVIGKSLAKNLSIDETDPTIMHFDWLITRGATSAAGTLAFNVCVKKATSTGNEEVHWNSELNRQMQVSPGIEYEEQKHPVQVDLISDLIDRMEEAELTVEQASNRVTELADGIENGYVTTDQFNDHLTQFDNLKDECDDLDTEFQTLKTDLVNVLSKL